MHKIGVRAFKTAKFLRSIQSPKSGTRCLSYVPIDDRFFGLSDEEIELRGMTLFRIQIFRSGHNNYKKNGPLFGRILNSL